VKKPAATNALTDDKLLQLMGTGDEDAFLTLYRRHQGPIFRFALHMSGNLEMAEEVTQEVFVALLSSPGGYSAGQGCLEGYLIGIARNRVRSHLRTSQRLVYGLEEITKEPRDETGELLFQALNNEQELAVLQAAILTLPPNYREVVVLCCIESLDYEQAAARLGCAVGTVRSRLHRARAILAAKLSRRERCTV